MADRSQRNVIKTLILVSVSFFVCWCPNQIYYLYILQTGLQFDGIVYTVTLLFIFMNVILNPFIYASKYDDVKDRMKSWFKKINKPSVGTDGIPTVSGQVPNALNEWRVAISSLN